MPGWGEWSPDVDKEDPTAPVDDTVIKRRPGEKEDDGDEDIPPHPGAPFGIPGRRRRGQGVPPPMQMNESVAPSLPDQTSSGWQY